MRGMLLLAAFLITSTGLSAAAAVPADSYVSRAERLIDALVKANFEQDIEAAGSALISLVEFERSAGFEPSGAMAVVQVRETLAFASTLEGRVEALLGAGYPVPAAVLFDRYSDALRFEPAGAARGRAIGARISAAGKALCDGIRVESSGFPAYQALADGICGALGGASAGDGPRKASPYRYVSGSSALFGRVSVSGTIRGADKEPDFGRLLENELAGSGAVSADGPVVAAASVRGTYVSTVSGKLSSSSFAYGIEVPYSEMEEYCEWTESTAVESVVEGGVERKVRRTVRNCETKLRPIDRTRVETAYRQVDGTSWTMSSVWQLEVRLDDGEGCEAARTFDGKASFNDFEHAQSDPNIGLVPDPRSLPSDASVLQGVAAQAAAWLVETETACLQARHCRKSDGPAGIEAALNCLRVPGSGPATADEVIVARFGVPTAELLRFAGFSN